MRNFERAERKAKEKRSQMREPGELINKMAVREVQVN